MIVIFFGKCFGFRDSFFLQPSYKAGMDGWGGGGGAIDVGGLGKCGGG